MKYQKFVPEGWFVENKTIGESTLKNAINTQEILEAKVTNCDENYNLYVQFADNKMGIINRNEIETNASEDIDLFKKKINKTIPDEIKDLDLKQRKSKLKEELKNPNLTMKELEILLLLDNTDENLICRYLLSLDQTSASMIIPLYSSFISANKLIEIGTKIFGEKRVLGYRKKSFKTIFFEPLLALSSHNRTLFQEKIKIMNASINSRLINNQPFDTENLEAFYYYICFLFSNQIKDNENMADKYIKNLEQFLSNLEDLKIYAANENFEEEKKDLNRFLIFCFSIINLDANNFSEI